MFSLVIFNGSLRKGQYTQHVTALVTGVAEAHPEFSVTVLDPRSLSLTWDNEGTAARPAGLKETIANADAFVIVTPEYNHGYPGSLKYMLDLSLKEYIHKPVAFVGVSKGPFGGTRVIESLVPVVRELGLVATFQDVNVSNVQEEVNEHGEWQDASKWERRIEKLLSELLWMTKALSTARQQDEHTAEQS
ncbi:NAD(P)H-dependent oxidoreductase [Candidatus Woesebacteria bacterium]|nr:NAD(P)H-dependent oxidoreductase [Candidatus Woesebacteria bacterium]MCD8507710.1 NAD(P)H-dependent oxidoreductase [Candidatus Woesebacteria bacterium]MCD8527132.1 NAD(P)H-dependent oxidoreductase [Candidatus Woesebacteria bacterium]MCD8546831.1 NAD(P)H-dependent oxidoreductase [Candidatus Woesebacteria bacterium]